MTHWNRLDIKNVTGEKPNKSTRFCFYFCTLNKFGSLGEHNAMHNNRLKPVRIPLSAVEWFGMRFNRSLHAWYCVRQGCWIFSKFQKNLVLLFGFPPVAILISNRCQCVIILNERKQISDQSYTLWCLSRGYTFWVMIVTFFAHCIINRY